MVWDIEIKATLTDAVAWALLGAFMAGISVASVAVPPSPVWPDNHINEYLQRFGIENADIPGSTRMASERVWVSSISGSFAAMSFVFAVLNAMGVRDHREDLHAASNAKSTTPPTEI